MDGAQATQRGEDVGEQRGARVVLQPLEHIDGPLELPALRMRVSDLGRPPRDHPCQLSPRLAPQVPKPVSSQAERTHSHTVNEANDDKHDSYQQDVGRDHTDNQQVGDRRQEEQ